MARNVCIGVSKMACHCNYNLRPKISLSKQTAALNISALNIWQHKNIEKEHDKE